MRAEGDQIKCKYQNPKTVTNRAFGTLPCLIQPRRYDPINETNCRHGAPGINARSGDVIDDALELGEVLLAHAHAHGHGLLRQRRSLP